MNRKYYIIRTAPTVELEYSDRSMKTPMVFDHWRDAYNYGLQNIGINRFEVVRMLRIHAGHPENKDGV